MNKRPETGSMQFDDDWPGVFIRGDNAIAYAMYLETLLNKPLEHPHRDIIAEVMLRHLVAILRSCDTRNDMNISQQAKLY